MRRRSLLLLLALLAAGCGDGAPTFHATDLGRLPAESILGTELRDFSGQPRQLSEFRGKLVILFFGYTTCPDICPTALAKYAQLLSRPELGPDRLQIIFITLDPERDSSEHLRNYLNWYSPHILGLRCDAGSLPPILSRFRITATRKRIPGALGYTIDHTAGAYVFDRAGRRRLYFAENARVDQIAADLLHLLNEAD